ncbi:MAG: delta(1)-pyrroline-2-carboxylate reductase family protein [Hydrogenophaga sp.]|uniref:delta(1)-pyrroline-2-carboxylate reductase family protein n=1 Tax=Hydrogenophaga sp. TaxID=1904254 RepID=UPI0016AD8BDF|nr:delta(1)-pyrroline-2-carboxylate reductase family protein [Hydrogenophaga sp.]NIM43807.1 delta(1)-pyrroline-2-carboxylate reductase family protein [Hydrogenophaga sp.]NIN28873.1 delta(1)-pyrroline-2-carboxylate reductase family protein [Hydrogenophaga sp.]NIN33332.1 delta(1)-pyrroline-2-carboxylate reductase family protein [Hydrogenophaga sp.]NIN58007.1 delta(1)-pyrroline-2-carboxylate reductase family protein [Hydrogenophaga sp.]NIO54305.1 delta(1)-pyrroline-2-carboxylate reductase family 
MTAPHLYTPEATAAALPYAELAEAIAALLRDPAVKVPARTVLPLPAGGVLIAMPATDARVAITKLISFVADNGARGLPAIQGDVIVFDARDGRRLALLDGPTVTARRTAAVSLLAAQRLAPRTDGPLLIVGAGVQGRAHLEAFASGLGVRQVRVASRSAASADALVAHARGLGLDATSVDDADAALADCPLVVSATPAQAASLHATPRDDAFIAAVGAFTPAMLEWAPDVCRHIAARGSLVVDTRDADHEAGDLLQAGLDVTAVPTLADWLDRPRPSGPVLFKSCGWAGWDLAAARLVFEALRRRL